MKCQVRREDLVHDLEITAIQFGNGIADDGFVRLQPGGCRMCSHGVPPFEQRECWAREAEAGLPPMSNVKWHRRPLDVFSQTAVSALLPNRNTSSTTKSMSSRRVLKLTIHTRNAYRPSNVVGDM